MNRVFLDEIIVFYVEDDEDDRMIFEDLLSEVAPNARLKMFKNGFELLHAVQNPPPSPAVVFVDLNLPGITGYDVLIHIRASEAFKNLPLIVFSTSDSKKSVQESRTHGANFYIVKSGNIEDYKHSMYIALTTDWLNTHFSEEDFLYQAR